ncbi:hypothetical protein DOA20_22305 [Salmonella enterica subsp. enterica serovar Newport]|nr:hypothetical protein [Salmonella enterica subsp. enterica serovar Newport]
MMLITLELQTDDVPDQSMLTLGMFCPDGIPGLADVIARYAEKRVVTPPGAWDRVFRGLNWWVRCIPAPAFMRFLREWRHVPAVNTFLDHSTRLVCTSLSDIPGVTCRVWVHDSGTSRPDARDTGGGRQRRKRRCPDGIITGGTVGSVTFLPQSSPSLKEI